MAGIDIISDSTGKEIVAAIQSTDVAQARILEINAAAESKKNEVLESIPEDYSNIVNEVNTVALNGEAVYFYQEHPKSGYYVEKVDLKAGQKYTIYVNSTTFNLSKSLFSSSTSFEILL